MPAATSRSRNLFRSKNSLVTISSFNSASQLSCKVSISSCRRPLCSSVSDVTQAALSNLDVLKGLELVAGAGFGAGELKKEAMLAFGLTFLAEPPTEVVALRLWIDDMAKVEVAEGELGVSALVMR